MWRKKRKRAMTAGVRRWLRAESPAKASIYFLHLKELAELGIRWEVIIYLRVSTQQQADKGYLDSQEVRVRKAIKNLGFKIARYGDEEVVLTEVSKGRISRDGLELVKLMAEDLCAIPVAEDVSRFIRNEAFCPTTNPSTQLTQDDIDEFRQQIARGTPFATIVHPDADYTEIRRYQKEFGMKEDKPAGYKKQRRFEKLPRVLKLYRKGVSLGEISRLVGIPKSTVFDWIRKYTK